MTSTTAARCASRCCSRTWRTAPARRSSTTARPAAPAPVAHYGIDDTVTGVPRSGPAFLAARRVSSWLIGNHSRSDGGSAGIDESPDAGLYAIEVIDAITAEAVALGYRPRPRKVAGRLCRVCNSETLRHTWPINGEPRLTCTACGEVLPCGPNLTRAVLETA